MKLTENGFVFFLFIELCVAISEEEIKEVAILKQMQDWGKAIFSSIEGINKGQYLVAVVLEDNPNPANFPKYLFNGCPAQPNFNEKILECRSAAVILNLKSKNVWERSEWANMKEYSDHSWHGEYRLLKDGIVKRLTDNFFADRPNVQCKIYLYSFFIPCAGIPKQPYSCSEIIAVYNNEPKTKCKVVLVGYTEVFRRSGTMKTNETASKVFLRKANAELKHITREVKVEAIDKFKSTSTFQELMFEYVINSPLSGCCVDNEDDELSEENRSSIVSYFVNAMIFNLKEKEDLANSGMNKSTKKKMMGYIKSWLKDTIGEECTVCSVGKNVNQFLLGFCVQTAVDLSACFGEPAERNDLSIPRWTPVVNGKISNIRMIDPSQFKNSKKGMPMCGMRTLSLDSLCSRSTQSTLPAEESNMFDAFPPEEKKARQD